jgi:hypothetical protein
MMRREDLATAREIMERKLNCFQMREVLERIESFFAEKGISVIAPKKEDLPPCRYLCFCMCNVGYLHSPLRTDSIKDDVLLQIPLEKLMEMIK